jgi:hypothetical protein
MVVVGWEAAFFLFSLSARGFCSTRGDFTAMGVRVRALVGGEGGGRGGARVGTVVGGGMLGPGTREVVIARSGIGGGWGGARAGTREALMEEGAAAAPAAAALLLRESAASRSVPAEVALSKVRACLMWSIALVRSERSVTSSSLIRRRRSRAFFRIPSTLPSDMLACLVLCACLLCCRV